MSATKILYITNQTCSSGGLERVLSIKASYLADHLGYEVHIMTLNQGDADFFYTFSSKIYHHDITVRSNPISYILDYRKGIKAIVQKIEPTIICVCDDGLKGFFVPKIIHKPCAMVYERHVSKLTAGVEGKSNFIDRIITKVKYGLMDYGAKQYDAFVVLTKGNLAEWKSNNLKVIPNPLSFFPEEKSTLKNKQVIAVGKHCYQKGYDRLLQSWKMVIEQHPDWMLDIYGAFNPDHDLQGLSNELGIEDHVRLFAPVKNIKDKFLESSIHVLASRFEGFGMVIIEAMSCGIPSVSYDCPFGPSDIISDQEDGILIQNGNIESFAKALIDLIKNEKNRQDMGGIARERVKSYSAENIAQQWDNLFQSLIQA